MYHLGRSAVHAGSGGPVNNELAKECQLEENEYSVIVKMKNIGFREVGKWTLSSNGGIDFVLDEKEGRSNNVLYSFISGSEVLYIGKTIKTLYKRMYGYKKPEKSQTTNDQNNKKILEKLQNNLPVSIYTLPDHGLIHYGGFHLNLAAGLEDDLINKICPTWNTRGVWR